MNQQNGEHPSEDIGQVEEIPTEITLECGAVLSMRKPPPMLIPKVMEAVNKSDPPPTIPKVFVEDKGREEENPNDPDYVAAQTVYAAKVGARTLDALMVSCLRVKEIGEAYAPEGEDFLDYVSAMGLEPASGKHGLFLQWLNTYALTREELTQLMKMLMQHAGVGEEDVAEAMKFLEGNPQLRTDSVPSA